MLSRHLLLGSVLLLILLGAVISVRKPWTKNEGERSEVALPGILPRPAPLASRRWQLETVSPRSMMHSIAWSPDGRFIALGTEVGNLRVYAAETGVLTATGSLRFPELRKVIATPPIRRAACPSAGSTNLCNSKPGSRSASLSRTFPRLLSRTDRFILS